MVKRSYPKACGKRNEGRKKAGAQGDSGGK
jgi:hypothetical protein